MRCVLALSVSLLVALLVACSEQPADNLADALATDPVRLKALRAQCATDRQATGEDACRAAAAAFRRRFFSGEAGPDDYRTLAAQIGRESCRGRVFEYVSILLGAE